VCFRVWNDVVIVCNVFFRAFSLVVCRCWALREEIGQDGGPRCGSVREGDYVLWEGGELQ